MGAHRACTLTSDHRSCLTGGGHSNLCDHGWLLWVVGQPLGGDASVSSWHMELAPCSTQASLGSWESQLCLEVMWNSSSACVLQKKDWSPREKGMKTQFWGLFDTYFSSSLASRSCEAAIRALIRAISTWKHRASSVPLFLPAPKMGTLLVK